MFQDASKFLLNHNKKITKYKSEQCQKILVFTLIKDVFGRLIGGFFHARVLNPGWRCKAICPMRDTI